MCHNVSTPDKWTLEHKDLVKYITLDCIVPHLKVWYDIAPDNIPTITQCIIKLSLLDVTAAPEAETSEAAFHTR